MLLQEIINIIQNPVKATYTIFTGTITGYAPDAINIIDGGQKNNIDIWFQYGVWSVTIIIGITAIITWIQKQYDRYRKRRG